MFSVQRIRVVQTSDHGLSFHCQLDIFQNFIIITFDHNSLPTLSHVFKTLRRHLDLPCSVTTQEERGRG